MYKIINYENPLLNKNFPMKFLRFLFKRNICEIKEKYKNLKLFSTNNLEFIFFSFD